MNRRLLTVCGGALNLAILFGPLWWSYGYTPWGRWELAAVSFGLTLFYFADCDRSETFNPHHTTAHDRRAIRLAYVMGIGLLITLWGALLEFGGRAQSVANWQIGVGGLLMLGGAVLRRLAVRALGSKFVTRITPRADHSFVETGIYAHLRHPSETAILLMVAGVAITLGSRLGIAALVFGLFPLVVYRLRLEDRQLAVAYGNRHAAYVDRVNSIVPRLPRLGTSHTG